jgi:hypothetical protein
MAKSRGGDSNQYVGKIIKNIGDLRARIKAIPIDTGAELLKMVLTEEPTPPWDTGLLRNSGKVYYNSKLIASSSDVAGYPIGQNPKFTPRHSKSLSYQGQVGLSNFSSKERAGGVIGKTSGEGRPITGIQSALTIVFDAPHANLMHELSYKGREPGSGPQFLVSKLLSFGTRFAMVAKRNITGVK